MLLDEKILIYNTVFEKKVYSVKIKKKTKCYLEYVLNANSKFHFIIYLILLIMHYYKMRLNKRFHLNTENIKRRLPFIGPKSGSTSGRAGGS